jgi:hypothetical protein
MAVAAGQQSKKGQIEEFVMGYLSKFMLFRHDLIGKCRT